MIGQQIKDQIVEAKKAKIKAWPCHVNRASNVGHPCERYLVLSRTAWDQKTLHDWQLQLIFELGEIYEEKTLEDLKEAGVQVVEQQRPFEWKELEMTGHIDCKIVVDDKAYPTEIKSMSPYVWESVNTVADMLAGKYVYLRKYPAQIMMYLLMDGKDHGLMILKNKVTGQYKIIDILLDYEYAEAILKKLERVNKHVHCGTMPDISDNALCDRCEFRHICLPDLGADAVLAEDDIIELLDERKDLIQKISEAGTESYKKRLDEINKLLKSRTEGIPTVMAGSYLISGKWVERKGFEVAATKYWKIDILD